MQNNSDGIYLFFNGVKVEFFYDTGKFLHTFLVKRVAQGK